MDAFKIFIYISSRFLTLSILCLDILLWIQYVILHVSSFRNFCYIPDYIDGMVMYEYIAILYSNFKGSPRVQNWILSFPITITPQHPPPPTKIIWTVAKFFKRRYVYPDVYFLFIFLYWAYLQHSDSDIGWELFGQPSHASSTSPHMWPADGDSPMCYIVRMSRLMA